MKKKSNIFLFAFPITAAIQTATRESGNNDITALIISTVILALIIIGLLIYLFTTKPKPVDPKEENKENLNEQDKIDSYEEDDEGNIIKKDVFVNEFSNVDENIYYENNTVEENQNIEVEEDINNGSINIEDENIEDININDDAFVTQEKIISKKETIEKSENNSKINKNEDLDELLDEIDKNKNESLYLNEIEIENDLSEYETIVEDNIKQDNSIIIENKDFDLKNSNQNKNNNDSDSIEFELSQSEIDLIKSIENEIEEKINSDQDLDLFIKY